MRSALAVFDYAPAPLLQAGSGAFYCRQGTLLSAALPAARARLKGALCARCFLFGRATYMAARSLCTEPFLIARADSVSIRANGWREHHSSGDDFSRSWPHDLADCPEYQGAARTRIGHLGYTMLCTQVGFKRHDHGSTRLQHLVEKGLC